MKCIQIEGRQNLVKLGKDDLPCKSDSVLGTIFKAHGVPSRVWSLESLLDSLDVEERERPSCVRACVCVCVHTERIYLLMP